MKDWPRYVPKKVTPDTEEKLRTIFDRMKGSPDQTPSVDGESPEGDDLEVDKAA